jgi:hypothetical protein
MTFLSPDVTRKVREALLKRQWYEGANAELRFSLFPRRCYETKKWLWLKRAYRLGKRFSSYGGDFVETRWIDEQTFVLMRLKGEA